MAIKLEGGGKALVARPLVDELFFLRLPLANKPFLTIRENCDCDFCLLNQDFSSIKKWHISLSVLYRIISTKLNKVLKCFQVFSSHAFHQET